jgi:hypothetical protein
MTFTVPNDHIARTGLPYPSFPGGRMSLAGLGAPCADSGTCGPNPCGWFDNIWISDACRSFCQCSDPTSWGSVGVVQATANEAGSIIGGAVGNAAGAAAQGVGNQLNSLTGYIMLGFGALILLTALKG